VRGRRERFAVRTPLLLAAVIVSMTATIGSQSLATPPAAPPAPTAGATSSTWTPPATTIETVYIVPTSHYDFGFVEPPDAVRERAARHLDEVLRLADADPRFRWTIESVWQVNEWLKRARAATSVLPKDEEKIARLVAHLKSGRIALSASWGSMHTDFMGVEMLDRLAYDATALKRKYGVESTLAVLDDVPGHPMGLPSVLAASGVRHLLVGVNQGLMGGTSLAPGKVPFYWEGPDGGKVLTWISQGVRGGYVEALTDFYLDPFTRDPYTAETPYEMFNPTAPKKAPLAIMEEGVTALLERYAKAGYTRDAVLVMYAHDFIEPSNVANLQRAVALWNGAHASPTLRIATPPEFFAHVEQTYGATLETRRGEWSGLWSEAKTHSPRMAALARFAQDHTPVVETLWSALSLTRDVPHPTGNIRSLFDWIFTFDEHSGAGNTGWPTLNSRGALEEQNRQYAGYLTRARGEIDALTRDGLGLLAQPADVTRAPALTPPQTWSLIVYNPLSWPRTDVVEVAAPEPGRRITGVTRASDARAVPFDVTRDGRVLLLAQDIPSLGYDTFLVQTAEGDAAPTTTLAPNVRTIGGAPYQVTVDAAGDIESVRASASRRELVNGKSEARFNQLRWMQGPRGAVLPAPAAARIDVETGGFFQRMTIVRPRAAFASTVITVYRDLDRVDIRNTIDERLLPFVSAGKAWHDAYYFAFPFALDPRTLTLRAEGHRGFSRLPQDYFPGARQDATTTQHAMGLEDGTASVTLAHREAFHAISAGFLDVQPSAGPPPALPAMLTGKWPLPEATIYSRALRRGSQSDTHDLGVVNLDTVEPGLPHPTTFAYSLSSGAAAFDAVRASHQGWELNVPLLTRYAVTLPAAPRASFFGVDRPNVQILTVKPLETDKQVGHVTSVPLTPRPNRRFVIRLQEVSGTATDVRVMTPMPVRAARVLDLVEERVLQPDLPTSPLTIRLRPFEVATVAIELDLESKTDGR